MNFTVIIPHKNIPLLLERLIKSIPMRDDLEIIVVDDYSDARVVEQLRSLEREDSKFILNQECHGAGYARNCALPLAKGKWVLFADSDDFFNLGFNDFLNEYTDSDADIVYFNANSVDTDTYEPSNRVDHLHGFIEEYHKDKNKGELIMRYLFTEPWCKMVKREIIESHHIKFEETSIRNDVRYSYLVGHYAAKIIVDDRQLYCVTTRQNSVSRGKGHQAALDELKHWGYLVVTKLMPNETNSGRIEYVYDFYEYSEKDTPDADQNDDDTYDEDGDVSTVSVKKAPQGAEKQGIENLPLEILPIEIQAVENQGQINTKKKIKKNQILSDQVSINQSPSDSEKVVENVESQTDGLIDGYISEKEVYTDVVKTNIEFPYFAEWLGDEEEAEEIVQMIVRRICSRKKTERICGQDFPREVVKSAMLKVDINVLENAIEQMKRTDNVRNYESYLISTLFNEANGKRFKENAEGRWAEYAVKRDFGGYDD